jgi:hypothetical protein
MKNLIKAYFVFSVLTVSMAACTAGDKGSENRTDSSSVDTSQSGSPGSGGGGMSSSGGGASGGGGAMSGGGGTSGSSGTSGGSDSSGGDKLTPGSIPRDTTQKDRSANGGADFEPKKTGKR